MAKDLQLEQETTVDTAVSSVSTLTDAEITTQFKHFDQSSLEADIKKGVLLKQKRDNLVETKGFTKWLKNNIDVSSATAYRYIKLAEVSEGVVDFKPNLENFSREAFLELSKHDGDIVEQICQISQGQYLTKPMLKGLIAEMTLIECEEIPQIVKEKVGSGELPAVKLTKIMDALTTASPEMTAGVIADLEHQEEIKDVCNNITAVGDLVNNDILWELVDPELIEEGHRIGCLGQMAKVAKGVAKLVKTETNTLVLRSKVRDAVDSLYVESGESTPRVRSFVAAVETHLGDCVVRSFGGVDMPIHYGEVDQSGISQSELEKLRTEVAQVRREKIELRSQLAELKEAAQCNDFKEHIRQLNSQLENLQEQNANLISMNNGLQVKVQSLESQLQENDTTTSANDEQTDQGQGDQLEKPVEKNDNTVLKTLGDHNTQLETTIAELQQQLATNAEERNLLVKEKEQLKLTLRKTQQHYDELTANPIVLHNLREDSGIQRQIAQYQQDYKQAAVYNVRMLEQFYNISERALKCLIPAGTLVNCLGHDMYGPVQILDFYRNKESCLKNWKEFTPQERKELQLEVPYIKFREQNREEETDCYSFLRRVVSLPVQPVT